MRKSFKGKPQIIKIKDFPVNEKILAREVVVIDEEGQNLGTLERLAAIELAKSRGLDLVEVSPKAEPPICKILDYGSFKYQREKLERKQKAKQKTVETKTITLSFRISQHDLALRANQAVKFLTDGDKVKVEMPLRGRENQHSDLARETIGKMIDAIKAEMTGKEARQEQPINKLGNKLSTIIFV